MFLITTAIVFDMWRFWLSNRMMLHQVGAQDIDWEWGFGQVTAIATLLPAIIQTLHVFFMPLLPFRGLDWLHRQTKRLSRIGKSNDLPCVTLEGFS